MATRPILPGEVIFNTQPAVLGPCVRYVQSVKTKNIKYKINFFSSLLFTYSAFLKKCLNFSKIHYIAISGLGLREPNVYPASSCWAPSHTPAPDVSYPFATHNAPGKPLNCSCLKLLVTKQHFRTLCQLTACNTQCTRQASKL